MACGENPKRVYGSKGNMPQTRMGNIAFARATWLKAQAYKRKWDNYERNGGDMPERDLAMDTLTRRACAARSSSTTIATAPTKWR